MYVNFNVCPPAGCQVVKSTKTRIKTGLLVRIDTYNYSQVVKSTKTRIKTHPAASFYEQVSFGQVVKSTKTRIKTQSHFFQ